MMFMRRVFVHFALFAAALALPMASAQAAIDPGSVSATYNVATGNVDVSFAPDVLAVSYEVRVCQPATLAAPCDFSTRTVTQGPELLSPVSVPVTTADSGCLVQVASDEVVPATLDWQPAAGFLVPGCDRTAPVVTDVVQTAGSGCVGGAFTLTNATAADYSPPPTFTADGVLFSPAAPYIVPGDLYAQVTTNVIATDAVGIPSAVYPVTGRVTDTTGPGPATLEVTTDPAQQRATLTWDPIVFDGAPAITYLVTKGPQGSSTPSSPMSPVVQRNLQVDATYEFKLYATDACMRVGQSSIRLVRLNDTSPPSAPIVAGLAFDPATHVVQLAWLASSDNIQVDHYEILRNGVPIGATDATTFTDVQPTEHAGLSYVVRAVDTNGNETDSAPALISTPDWSVPTAPVLQEPAADGTTVTLRWSAAADNVGVVAYDVLRDGKQIASVTGATRTYKDVGVPLGSRTWQVRARDNAGLSATSAPKTLTIKKPVAKATLVSVRSTKSGRGTARYSLGGPARLLIDMRIVGTLPKARLRLYIKDGRGRITVWRGTPGSSAPRLQLGSALVRHGYVSIRLGRTLHAGRVRLVLIARGHISVAATGARKPKLQSG